MPTDTVGLANALDCALLTDAQTRMRHATINPIQIGEMDPHFPTRSVDAHARCEIYIFHGKGPCKLPSILHQADAVP